MGGSQQHLRGTTTWRVTVTFLGNKTWRATETFGGNNDMGGHALTFGGNNNMGAVCPPCGPST